jgi:transcriptional regulator with XRE-family HTH domain
VTNATRDRTAATNPADAAGANVVGSCIHAARRRKGMMLVELAERTGLDKGYLSRVERGQKSPSIGTLLKIAEALAVPVSQLFGENTDENAIVVIRRDAHVQISDASSMGPGSALQALLPADGRRRLSVFMVEPGSGRLVQNADHPGDEFLYVLEGIVEVILPDRVVELEAGDALVFDGHLRHQIRRVGEAYCRALIVVAQDLPLRGGDPG